MKHSFKSFNTSQSKLKKEYIKSFCYVTDNTEKGKKSIMFGSGRRKVYIYKVSNGGLKGRD